MNKSRSVWPMLFSNAGIFQYQTPSLTAEQKAKRKNRMRPDYKAGKKECARRLRQMERAR